MHDKKQSNEQMESYKYRKRECCGLSSSAHHASGEGATYMRGNARWGGRKMHSIEGLMGILVQNHPVSIVSYFVVYVHPSLFHASLTAQTPLSYTHSLQEGNATLVRLVLSFYLDDFVGRARHGIHDDACHGHLLLVGDRGAKIAPYSSRHTHKWRYANNEAMQRRAASGVIRSNRFGRGQKLRHTARRSLLSATTIAYYNSWHNLDVQ